MRSFEWPAETRMRALELKKQGKSHAQIAYMLGVPHPTVKMWVRRERMGDDKWRESCRAYKARYEAKHPERVRAGKRDHKRRERAISIGRFDPIYNPDPALLPMNKLWLKAPEVVEKLEEVAPYQEIRIQLPLSDQRRLYDIYKKQRWVRLDIADRIFAHIGLVLSSYEFSEPVFAAHSGGPDSGG